MTTNTNVPARLPNNPIAILGPMAVDTFFKAHDMLSNSGVFAVAAVWQALRMEVVSAEDVRDMAAKPQPGDDSQDVRNRRVDVTKKFLTKVFAIDDDADAEKKGKKNQAFPSMVRDAAGIVHDAEGLWQDGDKSAEHTPIVLVWSDDLKTLKNVKIVNALNVNYYQKKDDSDYLNTESYLGSAKNKGRNATHTFKALVSAHQKRIAKPKATGAAADGAKLEANVKTLAQMGAKTTTQAFNAFMHSDKFKGANLSDELKKELQACVVSAREVLGESVDANPDTEIEISIKDATLTQVLAAARKDLADVQVLDKEALETLQGLVEIANVHINKAASAGRMTKTEADKKAA